MSATGRTLAIGLLVAAACTLGCNAPPPRVPASAEIEGLPAVSVDVASDLPAERVAVFDREDGRARLRNAVLDTLLGSEKRGTLQASELRLVVTRFRLRSTGSGVWLGAMAGADMLDVTVTVVGPGDATRSFDTGTGGIAAGLVKPSASGRFNGLVTEVAQRVVAQL